MNTMYKEFKGEGLTLKGMEENTPLMLLLTTKNYPVSYFKDEGNIEIKLGVMALDDGLGGKLSVFGIASNEDEVMDLDMMLDMEGVVINFKKRYDFKELPRGFTCENGENTILKRKLKSNASMSEREKEFLEVYEDLKLWTSRLEINYYMEGKRFICLKCFGEVGKETKKCGCGGQEFLYGNLDVERNGAFCSCGGSSFDLYSGSKYVGREILMMSCESCGDDEFGKVRYGGV